MSGFFESAVNFWLSIQSFLPELLNGALVVLELLGGILLLSWAMGVVGALARLSKVKVIQIPARVYIRVMRGTPTLIQIFLWYFGLPRFGIRLSPFVAGTLCLGTASGAFIAEIVRGAFLAIPEGQYESAQALGMGYLLYMRRIIFPQVIKVGLPGITNEAAQMLKNTSLLMMITMEELMLASQLIIGRTFMAIEVYIIAAFLYLIMTSFVTQLGGRIEKKLSLPYTRT